MSVSPAATCHHPASKLRWGRETGWGDSRRRQVRHRYSRNDGRVVVASTSVNASLAAHDEN